VWSETPFTELSRIIGRHRQAIDAALEHGLSNALIESADTKIRLITRVAFGFKDPAALIALAMLSLGGYRLPRKMIFNGPTDRTGEPEMSEGRGSVELVFDSRCC
jgi:transposase